MIEDITFTNNTTATRNNNDNNNNNNINDNNKYDSNNLKYRACVVNKINVSLIILSSNLPFNIFKGVLFLCICALRLKRAKSLPPRRKVAKFMMPSHYIHSNV